MKGKELSEEFRDKVVQRHKLGEGYKKISNTLGISLSTVRSIIRKWRVYGTTQTLPRSGRPSKINSWAKRILALELTMRPNATLKELQTSMAEMGENVHRSTIARSFPNCSRNGRKRQSQTNNNLESRMAFVTKHLDYTSKMGKNPAKPRIKMSSYAYFVHTCREEHKKEHPEDPVNFSEFSKKCSEKWKSMSAEEKGKFVDLAELDKVRSEMESQLPSKGAKKTPNKSPPSAFFIFCDELQPQVMEETPDISLSELAKKLGEKWNNLTAEDKVPYEKKAAKLKEKYEKGKVPVSMPTKGAAPVKDDDDDDCDDDNDGGDDNDDDDSEDSDDDDIDDGVIEDDGNDNDANDSDGNDSGKDNGNDNGNDNDEV